MGELRIVVLLVVIVACFGLVHLIPPDLLVWSLIGLFNLINLAVTAINLWQAWVQDKRFLHAAWLGTIALLLGVALLLFFIWFGQSALMVSLAGIPWVAGGVLVLVLSAIRAIRYPDKAPSE